MFELSVKGRFSAAHHLPGYQGACAVVHGHNWDVEVFVRGTQLDATGILFDFKKLREALRLTLEVLDHSDLNRGPLSGQSPTSETIARYIHGEMTRRLAGGPCRVHRVVIAETPDSHCAYWDESAESPAHD